MFLPARVSGWPAFWRRSIRFGDWLQRGQVEAARLGFPVLPFDESAGLIGPAGLEAFLFAAEHVTNHSPA